MTIRDLLSRIAGARGGLATVLLDLGDGLLPIPCRDIEQAGMIEHLWRAFHSTNIALDDKLNHSTVHAMSFDESTR